MTGSAGPSERKLTPAGFLWRSLLLPAIGLGTMAALVRLDGPDVGNRLGVDIAILSMVAVCGVVYFRWTAARLRDAGLFTSYRDILFPNSRWRFGAFTLTYNLYMAPSIVAPANTLEKTISTRPDVATDR